MLRFAVALCLLISCSKTWGQSSTAAPATAFAHFFADPTRFEMHGNSPAEAAKFREMTWRIHGQVLHWGSDTIAIPVDRTLDTVFFQLRANAPWDTLLTQISEPGDLIFVYNECCGVFDLVTPPKLRRVPASVTVRLRNGKPGSQYLARMDDAGVLLPNSGEVALESACRSAMFPNRFNISLMEVAECPDTAHCDVSVCMYAADPSEAGDYRDFQTVAELVRFQYLPTTAKPLRVIYDLRTKKLELE